MKKLPTILLFILLTMGMLSHAQQDTLAQFHQSYQTAMGMLNQLQNTTPQDSVAISKEWQRLKYGL